MRTGGPRTQSGTGVVGAARLVAFDLKGKVPTTFAYNPGIQYKLPYDSVIDIYYVGTSGQHLLQRRNINAPVVEKHYRVLPGSRNRAIAGLSMGGGHTWINWRRYLNDYAPKLFQGKSR